jgi:hypothetical protein
MPLVCPSWLLCCLLSSRVSASHHATASCLAVPPSVHFSLRCHHLSCPLSSMVRSSLVRPGCLCDTSRHTTTSRTPVPPPLIAPLHLIKTLLCLLSGWLLHCLSSHRRLSSASASVSHLAIASRCTPFMPLAVICRTTTAMHSKHNNQPK